MKNFSSYRQPNRKKERGTATLIVMILLMVMMLLVINNGRVLHLLGQELRFIERSQQQKFDSGSNIKTGKQTNRRLPDQDQFNLKK